MSGEAGDTPPEVFRVTRPKARGSGAGSGDGGEDS